MDKALHWIHPEGIRFGDNLSDAFLGGVQVHELLFVQDLAHTEQGDDALINPGSAQYSFQLVRVLVLRTVQTST